MSEIKTVCECGKEIEDVYKPQGNFEYKGCYDENSPYFKCSDCGVLVWG